MRIVTIDGPGGAGKSTVSRRVAERLGWRLLDTGAMYRAVTLAALRAGIDLESESAFAALVETLTVTLPPNQVVLNGEEIGGLIRTVEVTRASRYAADSPAVRTRLVAWQRLFAETEQDVITEGRDQGTIVFPDAYRKYFLTASDEARAHRRYAEFVARGEPVTFDSVLNDLRERDARDESRAIAPLRPAEGARMIDSSEMSLDQVTELLVSDILSVA